MKFVSSNNASACNCEGSKVKSSVSIVQRKATGSPSKYSSGDLEIIEDMIDDAVQLIGGFGKLISDGDTAFVKANVVTEQPPDSVVCTDPRILEALTSILLREGCSRVLVGEGASVDVSCAKEAFEGTGIDRAVERAGGEIVCLDEQPCVKVSVPNGHVFKSVSLPRAVLDSDVYVSVPKMKTHLMTLVTLGIKNSQGILSREDKVRFHREDFYPKMIDILKVAKPDLTLIDGILAGEGLGPIYPNPVEMNLVVASKDVVAADAVASAVMGIDPFEVTTTRLAHTEGMGVGDLDSIEISGRGIDEVKRYFHRPKWNPIGCSANAIICPGGTCHFCLAQISAALERLRRQDLLDKMESTYIITGVNPVIPEKSDRKVIIVGDCARQYSDMGIFVPGCPPLPHITVAKALGSLD
jgi:uncharacterized protein (DUF362 family)